MRVAFDEQIFLLQRRGGISRQFTELIRWFEGEPGLGVQLQLPFRDVANDHLAALDPDRFRDHDGRLARRALRLRARARPARRDAVDLVHHTFFDPAFLRDYRGARRAITVYDLIPERQPQSVVPGVHLAKDEYVRRADLILVQTQWGRADFADLFGDVGAEVAVVPLGVDAVALARGGPRPVDRPYVLFVGQRSGYKDFATLLGAFSRIAAGPDGDPDLQLLAVGGDEFSVDEAKAVTAAGLAGRVHQLTLPDRAMAGAYGHAAAFVLPSRYEGFGLPTLEAMAAGAPVILSDASCLPEVGGDSAQYFATGDADALARCLVNALRSGPEIRELVSRGRQRALAFSWRETAARTAAAYRLVAG